MKKVAARRRFVNTTILFSSVSTTPRTYYNTHNYASSSKDQRTGDRTTPTTPPPVAARPNETMTQPQPSHANEKDFLSHHYSDMINVVKPKIKTTPQLNTSSFGSSAKRARNADDLLNKAKKATTAFIPADKAQRFARDLFNTSVQYENQLPALLEDLSSFSNSIKTDPYLNQMFKSSLTPANVRRSALSQLLNQTKFKSYLTPEALRVLSDIKALSLIGTVTSSLQRLSDLLNKKIDINVTLATDSEAERKKVTEQLRSMIGDQAQANFNFKVDPELISGLKAETMGQILVDTTGRKGLEDDASKYMVRLDDEIQRLKAIRNRRYSSSVNPQGAGKAEWDELLDEVRRLNKVNTQGSKGSQQDSSAASGSGSSSSSGESEDDDRVRALTEIYKFKRSKN